MIIGIIVAVLVVAWVWLGFNSLVQSKNSVEGAFAQIDVELKRRFDLIPNLVETVKGYASHEKEVFQQVTQARNMVSGAQDLDDRFKGENQLSGALGRLIAVAEAYPELKANQNFVKLQSQLTETENRIERVRSTYNNQVMQYHKTIRQFPKNILAGIFNYGEQPYFEATKEERENVKVKF